MQTELRVIFAQGELEQLIHSDTKLNHAIKWDVWTTQESEGDYLACETTMIVPAGTETPALASDTEEVDDGLLLRFDSHDIALLAAGQAAQMLRERLPAQDPLPTWGQGEDGGLLLSLIYPLPTP